MPPAGYPAFLQYLQSGRVGPSRRRLVCPLYSSFGGFCRSNLPPAGACNVPAAPESKNAPVITRAVFFFPGHRAFEYAWVAAAPGCRHFSDWTTGIAVHDKRLPLASG